MAMAAPMVEYMSPAPVISAPPVYAAPPVVEYISPAPVVEYVAPPPTYAAPPMAMPTYAAPPPAIPDPETVKKQKAAYEAGIQKQFTDGVAQIAGETKVRKDQLMAMAQQQKAAYKYQKEAEMQAQ